MPPSEDFILWMCHHHPELRLQCNLSKLLNSRAGTADTGIDYFRKLACLPKAPLCKVWNLTIKKLCWGELSQKGQWILWTDNPFAWWNFTCRQKLFNLWEKFVLHFWKIVKGKIIKLLRVKNKKTCWLVTSWKFYPIFGMMRGLLRKKGKVPISNFTLFYRIKYMLHA